MDGLRFSVRREGFDKRRRFLHFHRRSAAGRCSAPGASRGWRESGEPLTVGWILITLDTTKTTSGVLNSVRSCVILEFFRDLYF